ncbi:uroporphyrinogen-III synthase [Cellvibrio fontiphilus]|uniref:Uroporphyrinogen-III synthase n=1 Tax=Cellvibrio fontiphilus TaxID=1815559 RepID=A0ABV7FBV9_9GAMM
MLNSAAPCIVITRPSAQAGVWAARLHALGFTSRCLPLLELRALQDETQQRAIKNKILDFDLYQKVIFVSQNAVDFGMNWLEDYWPQLPIGIEYFAVGATTAKKLASYGIAVTDLATSVSGGMTSEDLLAAPQLQQVDGDKILIFRGLGGRGQLADTLRARGAWVEYCELYERLIPAAAAAQLQQLLADINATDAPAGNFILALHSGESLQNLLALAAAHPAPPGALELLQQQPLLVPSKRIAEAASAAGFITVIAAQNATDPAMTAALLDYVNSV